MHCTAQNINRIPPKIHRSDLIMHNTKSIILQLPNFTNDANYIIEYLRSFLERQNVLIQFCRSDRDFGEVTQRSTQ